MCEGPLLAQDANKVKKITTDKKTSRNGKTKIQDMVGFLFFFLKV
jgi:hypothetical protein